MNLWSNPEIRLYHNPWSQTVTDGVVLQQLQTAVSEICEWGKTWADDIDTSKSYACVILDPTNRLCQNPLERLLAAVLFGPDAEKYLPNAMAKADFRFRINDLDDPEYFLENANYVFGDDDFAYAGSAAHNQGIVAGSGLSEEQDGVVALGVATGFFPRIHRVRQNWLEERRRVGKQAWFNQDDKPTDVYGLILKRRDYRVVQTA